MKPYLIYFIILMFNQNHSFKIDITKCHPVNTLEGFCREKKDCFGVKEELMAVSNCPPNFICCPNKGIAGKKCQDYSDTVYQQSGAVSQEFNPVTSKTTNDCGMVAQPLIYGGEKAAIKEFPPMVAIGYFASNKSHVSWECGGTLISEFFVLTAGHCISKTKQQKIPRLLKLGGVSIGSTDRKTVKFRKIDQIIFHPQYKPKKPLTNNDLALLKMNKRIKFSSFIMPTCLDHKGEIVHESALAIGYGEMNDTRASPNLLKVQLNIIDRVTCEDQWKHYRKKNLLDDSKFCAGSIQGGRDTCRGDSGGPLLVFEESPFCMFRQIAVTSAGRACGYKNSVNIYTRVFSYIPWIESVVWPGEDYSQRIND